MGEILLCGCCALALIENRRVAKATVKTINFLILLVVLVDFLVCANLQIIREEKCIISREIFDEKCIFVPVN